MGNLIDYVDWRGDLSFSQVELCEVDSLLLSLLSYVDFEGIVPSHEEGGSITLLGAMREFNKINKGKKLNLGKFIPPELLKIAVRAAKSRRFGGIRLSDYVHDLDAEVGRQFCALTFKFSRDKYFVAFRGTDDTLVGWKESFNMSFMSPIPAQLSAEKYFSEVANTHSGVFYLGGHSKGGNLAVYASAQSEDAVKERIVKIFNHDGPGFDLEFITGDNYQAVREKIVTLVPQSSVVGMLLEHEENYEVIKSNAGGIMQHTAFSWEVMGGSFIHLDSVSEDSRLIDEKMKEWLGGLTVEEREEFIETIFNALASLNATTLTELSAEKLKLIKAWNTLDPKAKSLLLQCVSILIKHNALTIKTTNK